MRIKINNDMIMDVKIKDNQVIIKPLTNYDNLKNYEFSMDKYESAEELLSNIDRIYKNINNNYLRNAIYGGKE